MNPAALPHAETWHFFVGLGVFAVLGAIGHVCRAVFNVLPDRLSDNERMDMILSDGYNWTDRLFGTEYNDAGYYELYSRKNFRHAVVFSIIGGMVALLVAPGAADIFAYGVDTALVMLKDLFFERLSTLSWV